MSVNDMQFQQIATTLNTIANQVTGVTNITPTNTGEFVSVAQTALKTGYDPVLNALSQIISRTIFSIRPYYAKFRGLMVDEQKWGNHVRKVNFADKPLEADARYEVTDGDAIDQQKVNAPAVVQTNFYGANTYQKSLTIFRDQLDCAFRGPEEFASFVSGTVQNVVDQLEQARESMARYTVANLIGGTVAGRPNSVIKLVTEYNDVTGLQLDADSVKKPENFTPFIRWAYGRIRSIADLFTERSAWYHTNLDGASDPKTIMRHTPYERQKLYVYAQELNNIESAVLSNTFSPEYMRLADHERVNFWQSIETPLGIQIKPTYMLNTGALTTPAENVTQSNIFAVLFDEESAGVQLVNQWTANAPFNAAGGYTNTFWHETCRYWNDFTENCVVFLLE